MPDFQGYTPLDYAGNYIKQSGKKEHDQKCKDKKDKQDRKDQTMHRMLAFIFDEIEKELDIDEKKVQPDNSEKKVSKNEKTDKEQSPISRTFILNKK